VSASVNESTSAPEIVEGAPKYAPDASTSPLVSSTAPASNLASAQSTRKTSASISTLLANQARVRSMRLAVIAGTRARRAGAGRRPFGSPAIVGGRVHDG
jgi:hypothetical protein